MYHECSEEPKGQPIVIEKKPNGKWMICVEDYGDWTPINHCPFCGIKLLGIENA